MREGRQRYIEHLLTVCAARTIVFAQVIRYQLAAAATVARSAMATQVHSTALPWTWPTTSGHSILLLDSSLLLLLLPSLLHFLAIA